MVVAVVDSAAEPHCGGTQWSVPDLQKLAEIAALVLVGRAQHAARVAAGALLIPAPTPAAMRAQIRADLFPPAGGNPFHRDGLLFEIICWLVARQEGNPNDSISEPHTKATQQGVDTIKVSFDEGTRELLSATIYEYKCTTNARSQFRDHVVPAFRRYFDGARDPQIVQGAIALLDRYGLDDAEQVRVYSRLVNERPLNFQAALTVDPSAFPTPSCVALFDGYDRVTPTRAERYGDTFPLDDVRQWFDQLATMIWAEIDV